MRKRNWFIGLGLLLTLFATTAGDCEATNPAPDSDSQQSYDADSEIPTDLHVYDISGTVIADVKSLTRQISPATGSGFIYGSGGSVYGSSAFVGPVAGGKGFIRLQVIDANPATDLAPLGTIVILKTSDTKATALLVGDKVTFRCRRQYEAVAAVQNDQKFNAQTDATWELDFCRLATPVLGAAA